MGNNNIHDNRDQCPWLTFPSLKVLVGFISNQKLTIGLERDERLQLSPSWVFQRLEDRSCPQYPYG